MQSQVDHIAEVAAGFSGPNRLEAGRAHPKRDIHHMQRHRAAFRLLVELYLSLGHQIEVPAELTEPVFQVGTYPLRHPTCTVGQHDCHGWVMAEAQPARQCRPPC